MTGSTPLRATGIALAIIACPRLAHAQSGDAAIVVTARLDQPATDRVGLVRTLGRQDVDALSPVTPLEALTLVPGIDAFEKGGAGGGSYVSLRGGEPNFTLVTINGVRVNDPMQSSGGGFDFSLVAAGMVDRLDVVPGAQSTAYGADALAGVIGLRFGNEDDKTGFAGQAGVGSQGRHALSGRLALAGDKGRFALAAGLSDTRDFLAGSTSRTVSALATAAPRLGDAVALDLFGFYATADSDGFPEDSGGPELAVVRTLERRQREQVALGATLGVDVGAGATAQVRAGWSRSNFDAQSPGIAPGVLDAVPALETDSRFDRLEVVASIGASARDWLDVSMGASYVQERGTSAGMVDAGFIIPADYHLSRDMPGLFATATMRYPGNVVVRTGVRADWPEGAKARLSPRVGVEIPLGSQGFSLNGSYGLGFKRPSLFALGYPLIANPDLKDELARNVDAGLGWSSADGAWRGDLTYFRSSYRDLIDFDPERFTNVNRGRVVAEGVEVAASGQVRAVRVRTALTYMTTQVSDGAVLRFRPRWKGRLAADFPLVSRVLLRVDGEFSGAFNDSSVPTGMVGLDGYEIANAAIVWQAAPSIALSLAVRNIGDQRYYRTVGTPEPGRNVFLTLRKAI